MEVKSFAPYLPIFAAIGWGAFYAINARNYDVITVPTGLMAQGLSLLGAALFTALVMKSPVDITPFFDHPDKAWLWSVVGIGIFASSALHLSLKYNSATYTGLVEILYVILIPFFAYLFFGQKQLNPSMMIGGALMLVGAVVVMIGRLQPVP